VTYLHIGRDTEILYEGLRGVGFLSLSRQTAAVSLRSLLSKCCHTHRSVAAILIADTGGVVK
jgi:hypothetical protein